ncbi:MAG TPA: lysophospholipid acyltransferase family protein [Fimbriimonadaceae bacterium]|jgi:1-acyl-sn-glycerol-3-phosphate acyltransferase
MWYHFVLILARGVFWTFGGVKGVDEGNVPRTGGLIVAPLHVSNLDPEAVACGTNRHLRFMAKEELFKGKLFGGLIRSLGAFPVKRGEGDTESIRYAMDCLEKGQAVLIFPEGTRGDGKHIQPINRGVTMLAKRTGVPVMPVGVVGTHIAWPKGQKKIKRAKMRIIYGKPFTYAEVATGANEKENREIFARELQLRIANLCAKGGLALEPS